jgi:MFS family permease
LETISNTNKFTKASLLLASTMTIMAGATIAPSLPQIQATFSGHPNAEFLTRLILTMPAIFIAFLSPLAGYIIDKTGRRKTLLFSLLLYAVGGTSGLYLDHLYLILAGRALLGIAVAGTMTVTITLIADYFEGAERRNFIGYQASFMGVGGVIFIFLGGVLADVHWRLPFVLYTFSLFVFVMGIFFISEPKTTILKKKKNEKVKTHKLPAVIYLIYFTAFCGFLFFYIVPLEIPFLLKEKTSVSNSVVGFSLSISILMGALVSFFYAKIKAKLSYRSIYALCFMLMALGYFFIFWAKDYNSFLIGLIFQGSGMGLLMPNSNLWLVGIVPEKTRGRHVGALSFFVYAGQFLSPVFFLPISNSTNTQMAFGVVGLLMAIFAVGFLISNGLKKYK